MQPLGVEGEDEVALLDISYYGDPVLEKHAEPVDEIDEGTIKLLNDMIDTMRHNNGIGLAAPQVGLSKRIVVVEIEGCVYRMINPRIVRKQGKCRASEGCLSLPDIEGDVSRAEEVTVEFKDEKGCQQSLDASGLLARCFQHELDHLDGILFIQWLGTAAKLMLKKRLAALKQETQQQLKVG